MRIILSKVKFFKNALHFIARNLVQRPSYVVKYILNYYDQGFFANPLVLSDSVLRERLRVGGSFIRLGDGEELLIRGVSISYQRATSPLANDIRKIVVDCHDSTSYTLAIPVRFISRTNEYLRAEGLFHYWYPFKIAFCNFFPKCVRYADAHCFYDDGYFDHEILPIIRHKTLILVTNRENLLALEGRLPHDIRYYSIEARCPNPYAWFDFYVNEISGIVENQDLSKYIILSSAGPASKPLIFHFSKIGLQGIDIGHGIQKIFRALT